MFEIIGVIGMVFFCISFIILQFCGKIAFSLCPKYYNLIGRICFISGVVGIVAVMICGTIRIWR